MSVRLTQSIPGPRSARNVSHYVKSHSKVQTSPSLDPLHEGKRRKAKTRTIRAGARRTDTIINESVRSASSSQGTKGDPAGVGNGGNVIRFLEVRLDTGSLARPSASSSPRAEVLKGEERGTGEVGQGCEE